jgi:hypothetical protein
MASGFIGLNLAKWEDMKVALILYVSENKLMSDPANGPWDCVAPDMKSKSPCFSDRS